MNFREIDLASCFGFPQDCKSSGAVMLNKKLFLIGISLLLLNSCQRNNKKNENLNQYSEECFKNSIGLITQKEYNYLFDNIQDSIKNWSLNSLGNYNFKLTKTLSIVDSLICFNSSKNRFISAILKVHHNGVSNSDGINYFYGEKINNTWYFWTGSYIVAPREMFKNHNPKQPLTYRQLHQIALQEIFSGYLTKDGKINERWFETHFTGPGWGNFKDRYKYKWILDGNKIDYENEYWNYLRKKSGLILWITKYTNDSILKREVQTGRKLDQEEKNEISMFFSSKMVLMNEK